MAKTESLTRGSRTGSASDADGRWIPIGGRTGSSYKWTITNDVGYLGAGASVTTRVEVAQTRDSDEVVTVHTFGALTSPSRQSTTVTLSGYMDRGYLRTVANVNGRATLGTTEEADFFEVNREADRLTSRVQNWSEVNEAARQAEQDLLDPYREHGRYMLRMDRHGFSDDVREAIARQVAHRFQMWSLGQSTNPGDVVTLRSMAPIDRTARRMVRKYADTDVVAF